MATAAELQRALETAAAVLIVQDARGVEVERIECENRAAALELVEERGIEVYTVAVDVLGAIGGAA